MLSNIEDIFSKAGASWTEDERNRVWEWLHENEQLRRLLLSAKHWLGIWAEPVDAEEVWSKYNLYPSSKYKGEWIFPLQGVMKSYDPEVENALSFWDYLSCCFKRFCVKEAVRKAKDPTVRLEQGTNDGDTFVIEIIDEDPGNNSLKKLEGKEFRRALERKLQTLKPRHQEVFILCDQKNHTAKEAAEILDVPEGSVKGWLSRARQEIQEYLRKEGWK